MTTGDNDRIDGEEPQAWEADAVEPLETERLALDDEGERLPWLESSDDTDYNEYDGVNTQRMLVFVLMGLIALAAIVGGIWWATNRTADPALVADGSTIEAPDAPYKEAPKDPGGKTFEGTGDSSFAVSEGQTRAAQLGDTNATPAPAASASAPAGAASAGSASTIATAPVAAAQAGGVGVQVGAFSSQAAAEAGWARLVQQSGALSGFKHRVVSGRADIGTVYRLQAVAADQGAANALCGRLKAAGISCQVK